MSRETEKRQLRAGNFTMNNGRVLSTINLLRENTMPPECGEGGQLRRH